ncbi:Ig-like domain-containing protein [Spongiimicrobium salis]|uniref:Ig-like domain-containing protein n=1 Tax=Spongiimicrobium salis TaxID=1667022 RepID=UPI00374D7761
MKKFVRPLLRTLWVFLLLLACTKDVGLVTEVEFTLEQRHDNEGFVNAPLTTSFTVVPEALLEGYEYFLTYRIESGEGYFEDSLGDRVPEGEKVALEALSANYRYIGTVDGEHSLRIVAEDNFGFSEETELGYTIRQVPATWTATSEVSRLELGDSAAITITLGAVANNANATYERNYRIGPGSGSLTEASTTDPLELDTYVPIVPGSYSLVFVPDALGTSVLTFDLRDSNGQELTATLDFEVVEELLLEGNDITSFSLAGQTGASVIDTDAHKVELEVAFGTDLNVAPEALTVSEGASVSPLATAVRDFSGDVAYTVTAENGEQQEWTVSVSEAPSDAKEITGFVINGVAGTITGTDILVSLSTRPSTVLSPEITHTGASISPASGEAQDFSIPVEYTVTAADGSQELYTVVVDFGPEPSGDNDIVNFLLPGQTRSAIIDTDTKRVEVEVAFGTELNVAPTTLTVSTGASVSPSPTVVRDFGTAVGYTVRAENGDEAQWTVLVSVAADTRSGENDILNFVLPNQSSTALIDPASRTVEVEIPIGANIEVAPTTITVSMGATVDPGEGEQQDFNDPVTYRVTAENGDVAEWTVNVVLGDDVTPPVITLIGGNVDLRVGDTYNELGATAQDDIEGDLSGDIVIDASGVDTSVEGVYEVTYNVSDSSGNAADEVVRQVRVTNAPDTTPPVITLIGGDLALTVGDTYNELGATATDNVDGDISGDIVIDASAVNTNVEGVYEVTYNVSDAAGNAANQVVRQVTVVEEDIPATDLIISASSTSLIVGETIDMRAIFVPSNTTDQRVTWSSSNPAIASIDTNGRVTALAPGSTIITGTATANPTLFSSITFAILSPSIPVTGITVSPDNLSLEIGDIGIFNTIIQPANASNQNVNWISGNTGIATVDQNGNVTAVSEGVTSITAISAENGTITDSGTVTVTGAVIPVTGITVIPQDLTLGIGDVDSFNATITPANATNPAVNWISGNTNIVTVDQNGNVTAVSEGNTSVTAISVENGAITDSGNVTVTAASIPVTGIRVSPNSLILEIGDADTFSAEIIPANATNQNVNWISGDSNVVTVDQFGNITAIAEGSTTVTAISVENGSITDFGDVTVTTATIPVTGISVSPDNLTLEIGDADTFNAEIIPANATNQNVNWISGDSNIVTVDQFGNITAIAEGTTTVTAISVENGSITDSGNVTVTAPIIPVTSITINPSSATLEVGDIQQLSVTVLPANATNRNFTWSTSNAAVATIDENTARVTGVGEGVATIRATSVSDPGVFGTVEITVNPAVVPVAGISISPTTSTLFVGQTEQFTAAILPANATNQGVNWSTGSAAVATVNANGLLSAVGVGSTTVTARSAEDGNILATANITVEEIPYSYDQNTGLFTAPIGAVIRIDLLAQATPVGSTVVDGLFEVYTEDNLGGDRIFTLQAQGRYTCLDAGQTPEIRLCEGDELIEDGTDTGTFVMPATGMVYFTAAALGNGIVTITYPTNGSGATATFIASRF